MTTDEPTIESQIPRASWLAPTDALPRRKFSPGYDPEKTMPAAYWHGRMMVRGELLAEAAKDFDLTASDIKAAAIRHHELVLREYAARVIGS